MGNTTTGRANKSDFRECCGRRRSLACASNCPTRVIAKVEQLHAEATDAVITSDEMAAREILPTLVAAIDQLITLDVLGYEWLSDLADEVEFVVENLDVRGVGDDVFGVAL